MSPKVPRHLRHPSHPRRSQTPTATPKEASLQAPVVPNTEAPPPLSPAVPSAVSGEKAVPVDPVTTEANHSEAPEWLIIGQVIAPFGIRGELRIKIITDFPERFNKLKHVFIGRTKREYQSFSVHTSRWHQGELLLSLTGVDDLNAAQNFRGDMLAVPRSDAVRLPPGHYFLYQIIGLQVSTLGGEELGTITEVMQTGANDIYVVSGKRGTALIPATQEIVKNIDPAAGKMIIDPLPGLLDDLRLAGKD